MTMINIFTRRELTVTYSIEQESAVRTRLAAEGIDYIIRTVNRQSPSPFAGRRPFTGTVGQAIPLAYEYIFYVHRRDYERALFAIRSN